MKFEDAQGSIHVLHWRLRPKEELRHIPCVWFGRVTRDNYTIFEILLYKINNKTFYLT